MIPGRRLVAAVSAGAAVVAGVLMVVDPGAASARAARSNDASTTQASSTETAQRPAKAADATSDDTVSTTTNDPSDPTTAADDAQSSSASSGQGAADPSKFKIENAPRSTSGWPDFPSGDGSYPQLQPDVRVGAIRVIQSEGVALYQQTVGYGDPTEQNSYDVYWPVSSSLRRGGAVLMIHGGSWVMGRKELDTSNVQALARAGYVAATMDYSTFPQLRAWPAAAQDAFAVVDSLRSRADVYGFDPAHLVAAGWSAGGNLAELLGTVGRGSDRVAAVVTWSGISDMTALPTAASTVDLSGGLARFFGCALMACPRTWVNASPVSYVGPGDAPTLMFAGSREIIPTSQSTNLADKLHAAGVPADVNILDTALHGGDQRPLTIVPVMDWLHRYADAPMQVNPSTSTLDTTPISLRTDGK